MFLALTAKDLGVWRIFPFPVFSFLGKSEDAVAFYSFPNQTEG